MQEPAATAERLIAPDGGRWKEVPPYAEPLSGSIGRRILLAKVGLDGHDRGIKVIARGLRDAGFHVIYGGIWQSPDAVAQAVADEDADWLGISLLNGAHMSLIPRVIEQLRLRGLDQVGVIVGGIIPERDIASLKALGVSACFGPGTTITEIVQYLHSRPRSPGIDISAGVDACCHQDRRALSQLLTCLADGKQLDKIRSASMLAATRATNATPSQCRTIAFTGSAGVGKSTLIGRLLIELRASNKTVAVLTCDPESPLTGGALLGDRLRMSAVQPDNGVFIRSVATPSGSQGVAPNIDAMLQVLELFGFDVVIVETVGTGQGDTAIRRHVQTVVLLLQPESGDSVQWEKAGLLEIADVIVTHKSDLPGAERLNAELREHLYRPGGPPATLLSVSALQNDGVSSLCESLIPGCAGSRSM